MMALALRMAEQIFLYVPLLCAAYISFSLLRIPNFSFEAAFVFGAYCGATAVELLHGYHQIISLGLGLVGAAVGGVIIGLAMGLIVTVGRVPYLLASIITLGLSKGCLYIAWRAL